jgi:hypothetical protein
VYWGFSGFYGPYYYSPWYWSPYWYYPTYGYGWGWDASSLKVEVKPKDAEVYIDGHLAGIVDQFDGMFQSLSVESGGHEVIIYRDGYRSIRQRIYLEVGSTFRIKGQMEKLAPGEPNELRPQAAPDPQLVARPAGPEPPDNYPPQGQPQGPPPDRQASDAAPRIAGDARYGQVAIRVQPGDAQILIDGEPWRGPQGSDRLVVHLSPGTHRIEIRKDGFDPFVTAVEIIRGETAVLNVSLTRL